MALVRDSDFFVEPCENCHEPVELWQIRTADGEIRQYCRHTGCFHPKISMMVQQPRKLGVIRSI